MPDNLVKIMAAQVLKGRFIRASGAATPLILLALALTPAPVGGFEAKLRLAQADEALEKRLATFSLILTAKRDGVTNPQDILAAARADYGRLVGALYEAGFYGPSVSIRVDGREAADIPPLSRLQRVSRVDVTVTPGPLFHLGRAEIGPLAPATTLPAGFRRGQPAPSTVIRDTAKAGVDGWRARGHAKVQVAQQDIVADHSRAKLDVSLGLLPGPRVRFGQLQIAGNSRVHEARIRAIAGIPPGAVFSESVLENAAARLRRTGTFSSVSLREADSLGPGDSMDIELALVDDKPRRFGFGAELQSTEGATLSAFWMHRNLFNGAERLRVDGEVSGLGGETGGIDYRLSASLTRPSTFRTDTDMRLLARFEHLDERLYTSRQARIEVTFSRIFSRTLSAEAGVAYRFADVRDGLGGRRYSHLLLPLGVTWDRRDDPLSPTSGSYLKGEITPFVGVRGSTSGARGYLDARAYRGIGGGEGVVLAGRLQLGSVVGASIAETPPDMLFLSGGSGTVRGHSYQSLSIPVGAAVRTGGRSFIGLSGELRVPVRDKLGMVGFYDAGYVGANSWIDGTGGWQSGAGIGLRYQTGIGPIRLDVATPVTGVSASNLQVYLGIGQAF